MHDMPIPSKSYKRSRPTVPEGLVPLDEWAVSKKLTPTCVRKWVWTGRLASYQIPGYGNRAFIKPADAEACMKPRSATSSKLLR